MPQISWVRHRPQEKTVLDLATIRTLDIQCHEPFVLSEPDWTEALEFTFICDRFPQLEYLFGCFFLRDPAVALDSPDLVLRRFVYSQPAVVQETLDQLSELIVAIESLAFGEGAADEFLESMDCPYYPPFYGSSSLKWLKHCKAVLYAGHLGLPLEAPSSSASIPPLATHAALSQPVVLWAPEIPLLVPFIFLWGYRPLGSPAQLTHHLSKLSNSSQDLTPAVIKLEPTIALSFEIEPLLEVQ